jgi:tetratricopeptide (TPR) repeat protein
VAAALEAQGKLEEAASGYQNVVSRYPNAAVVSEAKLGLARIHELREQPEEAIKIYDELAGQTSATAWATQARQNRERVLAKHPELRPARTVDIGSGQSIQVVDPPGGRVEITPVEPPVEPVPQWNHENCDYWDRLCGAGDGDLFCGGGA